MTVALNCQIVVSHTRSHILVVYIEPFICASVADMATGACACVCAFNVHIRERALDVRGMSTHAVCAVLSTMYGAIWPRLWVGKTTTKTTTTKTHQRGSRALVCACACACVHVCPRPRRNRECSRASARPSRHDLYPSRTRVRARAREPPIARPRCDRDRDRTAHCAPPRVSRFPDTPASDRVRRAGLRLRSHNTLSVRGPPFSGQ